MTPVLSILACLYLISGLSWVTITVFGVWLVAALVFWALYGSRRSALETASGTDPAGQVPGS